MPYTNPYLPFWQPYYTDPIGQSNVPVSQPAPPAPHTTLRENAARLVAPLQTDRPQYPQRMQHIPRSLEEVPDNIADLPPMSVEDVQALPDDVYNAMFGSWRPSLVPATIEITNILRREEIDKDWQKNQAAKSMAYRPQGPAAGIATFAPNADETPQQRTPDDNWVPDWMEDSASWVYDKAEDAAGYVADQFDDLLEWGEDTIDDIIAGYQSMTWEEKQDFLLDILGVTEAQALLTDPANADLLQTGLFIASFTPWGKGLKVLRGLNKVRKLGKLRKAKGFVPQRGRQAKFAKNKASGHNVKDELRINRVIFNEMREKAFNEFIMELAGHLKMILSPAAYAAIEYNLAKVAGERDPVKLWLAAGSGAVTGATKGVRLAFANSFVTTLLQEIRQSVIDSANGETSGYTDADMFLKAIQSGAWAAATAILVGRAKPRMSEYNEIYQDLIEVTLNTFAPRILAEVVPVIFKGVIHLGTAVVDTMSEIGSNAFNDADEFFDNLNHPRPTKDARPRNQR